MSRKLDLIKISLHAWDKASVVMMMTRDVNRKGSVWVHGRLGP